jgi:hypothetical protein
MKKLKSGVSCMKKIFLTKFSSYNLKIFLRVDSFIERKNLFSNFFFLKVLLTLIFSFFSFFLTLSYDKYQ